MKFPSSLLLAATWCNAAPTAQPFEESISAQQLIGSHFGVPGPATYDYVILGGGTAGLALARRLAADSRYSVAVVNAGDFAEFANGNNSQIPAMASTFGGSDPSTKNPLLDWGQYTAPQSQLNGRKVFYMSGKVLGGASSRNYMWFPRAHAGALKKWAELTGDNSFLFQNFLPFYKKVSTFTPPNKKTRIANATTPYDPSVWSAGGSVQASYPNWANPISSWIEKGLKAMGLSVLPGGLADGNIWGYGYPASTIDPKQQSRSSSSTSYLREALEKTTNLNIFKNTLAKKIIFDGNRTATGAVVEAGGMEFTLSASKEVIVSAGFARSPQLLMVSGVGPASTLQKFGIDVVSDLPGVGQNMWDHTLVAPTYQVQVLTHSGFGDSSVIVEHMGLYRNSHTGLLTNNGGDILAFDKFANGSISKNTSNAITTFSNDWPSMMFMFLDAYLGWNENSGQGPSGNYASPMVALTAPFSRGNITISSTDTNDNPIVSPNWLLDPRDQEQVLAAFKRVRQVFTQKETKPVVIGDEVFPGLNVTTDAQILEFAKKQAFAAYHGSCTNAMGPKSNMMSVVDTKGRVYGVSNLRVVDASIFPVLPPGAPQHTVYALAEKIANDILTGNP